MIAECYRRPRDSALSAIAYCKFDQSRFLKEALPTKLNRCYDIQSAIHLGNNPPPPGDLPNSSVP